MKYHELSEEAKEKAREWMRACVESDNYWSEGVITDWEQILGCLGFLDVDIFWSGFWSQGDGACFAGSWRERDVDYAKLVEHVGEEKAEEYGKFFHEMNALFDVGAIDSHYVSLSHVGLYYHEHSVRFGFDIPDEDGGRTVPDFEEDFKEACQGLMRKIYKNLEEEYEYQLSDEAIEETIECNEYDFNEEGGVK